MSDLIDFSDWTRATNDLPSGVQRATYDALCLVSEEQIKMCYGSNVMDDGVRTYPCLVNTVASLLTTSTEQASPTTQFRDLVTEFDSLNFTFRSHKINDFKGLVSPLAAEILVQHFGTLKDIEIEPAKSVDAPYVEPSDEDMNAALNLLGYPSTVNEPTFDAHTGDAFNERMAHVEPPC